VSKIKKLLIGVIFSFSFMYATQILVVGEVFTEAW